VNSSYAVKDAAHELQLLLYNASDVHLSSSVVLDILQHIFSTTVSAAAGLFALLHASW
jgi:hypothetical protein